MFDLNLGMPSWFGKLPGTGDFAQRRMDAVFQESWDTWLQTGMLNMRNNQADWLASYLSAPLWFFAIGSGVVGIKPWLGVMMPSMDSVGRYFPLTLVSALGEDLFGRSEDSKLKITNWWSSCAHFASNALQNDLDVSSFEAQLQAGFFAMLQMRPLQAPVMQNWPMPGCSNWISSSPEHGLQAYTMAGLPTGEAFDALFGGGNST